MRARLSRAPEAALGFEPRRLPLALARTLLACAEAVGIACTPDRTLLPSAAPYPDGMRCAGIRSASAWCVLGPGADGRLAARIVEIVILVLVASGFRPRWTCVPHWYAAFSLAAAAVQPSGEDEITVIAVLLLVPLCLGDTRIWHWSPPGAPLAPAWRGPHYRRGGCCGFSSSSSTSCLPPRSWPLPDGEPARRWTRCSPTLFTAFPRYCAPSRSSWQRSGGLCAASPMRLSQRSSASRFACSPVLDGAEPV